MSKHQINLESEGLDFLCSEQQNLLEGMARLGKRGIPVGCRGGGCGVCKVQVLSGEYTTQKMSRCHVSEEEEQEGYVLACRCNPLSDISVSVIGLLKRRIDREERRESKYTNPRSDH